MDSKLPLTGYKGTWEHFSIYTAAPCWTTNAGTGTFFFSKFFTFPAVKTLCKQQWNAFKAEKLPLLLQYLDNYAKLVESSRKTDYKVCQTGGGNFKHDIKKIRSWLQNRTSYIDSYTAGW